MTLLVAELPTVCEIPISHLRIAKGKLPGKLFVCCREPIAPGPSEMAMKSYYEGPILSFSYSPIVMCYVIPEHIPAGTAVLYLGSSGKQFSKILHKDKILVIASICLREIP